MEASLKNLSLEKLTMEFKALKNIILETGSDSEDDNSGEHHHKNMTVKDIIL
jgi:hypothetical protein